MEEGLVRLEPRVERIEAGMVSLKDGVQKLDARVDRLEDKVDRLEDKVDRLDEKVDRLDEKVSHLDTRMTALERGFDSVRGNQAQLHVDLRDLRGSLDTKFIWMVTTLIAFGAGLLAVMAEGFHWLK